MREGSIKDTGINLRFHISYLVMALGFVLTGYYINLIIFTSLIIVHELGHYLVAKILKFNVLEIIVYPYGGVTKISDYINRGINEEILITSSGVIMQYFFYLFLLYLGKLGFIRMYVLSLIELYNSQIILFNLLPIYPLDGGKILNLLLAKFFSYNLANVLTVIISVGIIGLVLFFNIYNYSYSNIMIFLVLLFYLGKFFLNLKYLYYKFLLERYLYNIQYSKLKIINDEGKMYKDRSHLIKKNRYYVSERYVLERIFSSKKFNCAKK